MTIHEAITFLLRDKDKNIHKNYLPIFILSGLFKDYGLLGFLSYTWFEKKEYIKTNFDGYQKKEILKKFNLNKDDKGVKADKYEAYELTNEKDDFGNRKKRMLGRMEIGVHDDYLNFLKNRDKISVKTIALDNNLPNYY